MGKANHTLENQKKFPRDLKEVRRCPPPDKNNEYALWENEAPQGVRRKSTILVREGGIKGEKRA